MLDQWYEAVAAHVPLTQGDLIFDCPVVEWLPDPAVQDPETDEHLMAAVSACRAELIVMTQACDLAQEKVAKVVLCPHVDLSEYRT